MFIDIRLKILSHSTIPDVIKRFFAFLLVLKFFFLVSDHRGKFHNVLFERVEGIFQLGRSVNYLFL